MKTLENGTAGMEVETGISVSATRSQRGNQSADANKAKSLNASIDASISMLRSLQREDGHWCAELEGDTILESEYILLQAFLGRTETPKIAKCARYIATKQVNNGAWGNFPGGPADISVSVKAYFALKIAGYDPASPTMIRAREEIHRLGGAENVNSFTRFYLAALGQLDYSYCPSVPPEMLYMPTWFPINLHAMSSWTRTIVVPLSIFCAFRPVTELPKRMGIAELFVNAPPPGGISEAGRLQGRMISWSNFFRLGDRALKLYERYAPQTLRRGAIKRAEKWMLERFDGSDGLGAIFPPMVYTIISLKCLGYAEDSPEMKWAEKQLDDLIIEEGDTIRLQPCFSPVWDTAWAMMALGDAEVPPSDSSLRRAADWLLEREVRQPGDWAVLNKGVEPSGWVFEYNNRFYVDVDDTAAVLMALRCAEQFQEEPCKKAIQRSLEFINSMQCRDKGWAAFDKNINNPVLEAIPFADHNAMLDPSCPDITARVLEMLGYLGYRRGKPAIDQAIDFVLEHQEPEGCWFGRWGVNYIYGTWQVLVGMAAIGFDMKHPRLRRAVDWLLSVQQPNGGWGESCLSYNDRNEMGKGETTPSQTAWAILGLLAARHHNSEAVQRGIDYLIRTQKPNGDWEEEHFTGTGFPKVFYLRYHYYRLYFPLMALARYRTAVGSHDESRTGLIDYPNTDAVATS